MKTKILSLLLLSTTLAGCGLDKMENKKSDFQTMVKDRQALAMPVTAPTAPAITLAAVQTPAGRAALANGDEGK